MGEKILLFYSKRSQALKDLGNQTFTKKYYQMVQTITPDHVSANEISDVCVITCYYNLSPLQTLLPLVRMEFL